jgi:preprotein translocase subunit SecA
MHPLVDRINALEAKCKPLDQDALRRHVGELRERAEKGEPLDALLPDAFAIVREASVRTLGMRPFDVQLIGGMALHEGKIAEMKTGEGKTLVATLPAFLNALPGKGVHIVTVNDFLARRDAEWMGQVHRYLGLSVGCVIHGMGNDAKVAAYGSDITYGQNNEFGFDYLRDNMKQSLAQYFQRDLHYAIVDEVDSILIDEARTPLIISGPVNDDPGKFARIDHVIPKLDAERHYTLDEKAKQVALTDEGVGAVEETLGIDNLYAPEHIDTLHVVQNALRAHVIYKRDVDYVVKDGQVIIVDEFTGRLMEGRRWSDGLHQAVEAKEQVQVQNETQTFASITFQNYFRMYKKLAGMTGTADTEAAEFAKIYNLEVLVVPTNVPMIRKDCDDVVYRTRPEKWNAVVDEIEERYRAGQPTLVGTIAIETSELIANRLKNRGIRHNVLNAKQHAKEAEIIAQAGRLGSVTISTNMAGRGTDIVLGGNPEMTLKARGLDPTTPEIAEELARLRVECAEERSKVLELGGLFVLGTERHESRRIDNQLRGRSGRQGDPGESQFVLSLEDDLMRIFGGPRMQRIMERLGMKEGEAIQAGMLSGAIERAQAKVEARHFDQRKHLLEYDDVMNKQRETIYTWRRDVLGGADLKAEYASMAQELCNEALSISLPERGELDADGLAGTMRGLFGIELGEPAALAELAEKPDGRRQLTEQLRAEVAKRIDEKVQMFGDFAAAHPEHVIPSFDDFARAILLEQIDTQWKDHLLAMDHLRDGVGLRGYGGQDPRREYQKEGFNMFGAMHHRIRERAVYTMLRLVIRPPDEAAERARQQAELARRQRLERQLREQHATFQDSAGRGAQASPEPEPQMVTRDAPKVGRNAPCPCGSGRKHKQCCGKV